jgi:hypothetical protein
MGHLLFFPYTSEEVKAADHASNHPKQDYVRMVHHPLRTLLFAFNWGGGCSLVQQFFRCQTEGTAFIPCRHRNLEMIFTQRYERTVDRDNTVRFNNLVMQLERAHWRDTLAGCKAIIHQHLDMTLTLMIAGHRIGHYSAEGKLLTPLSKKQIKAVEKTLRGKVPFPLNLQIPQNTRDSHFPTASTATNL